MNYEVVFTKHALKDWEALQASSNQNLVLRVRVFIELVRSSPFVSPPPFKKLNGEFSGLLTRRLSPEHRFVYQVYENERTVKIISVWGHLR